MAQAYHAMASKEFGVGKTEVSFSLTIALFGSYQVDRTDGLLCHLFTLKP